MPLERYREMVDDWEAFRSACARPEPTTFRARAGRVDPEELLARLRRKGFRAEAVAGVPDCWRVVEAPHPLSQTLEHWLGLLYIQQAVTALAAPALGPGPDDRVLDMCAAPGGKTSHLADLTDDRGSVVAVDVNDKRLRALLGNVYRMAHPNVLVAQADAGELPEGARFDRVLVDAPCSAEGNVRQRDGVLPEPSDSFKEHVVRLQERLLRKAVALTRPGGSILYATCTFAPDENEGVVDAVLRDAPVEAAPIELDAAHAPGLEAWNGRSFHPGVGRAWRLYPHHLDSGGLFLARLRRLGDGEGHGDWRPAPRVFPGRSTPEEEADARVEEGLRGIEERFGVCREALDGYRWTVRGKSVWAHRLERWPDFAWRERDDVRVLAVGLRALKRDPRMPEGVRPTNELLQRLDGALAGGVVELETEACLRLLDGEALKIDAPERGFVALRVQGWVVGRGWVKEGRLRPEISKGRARRLSQVLESGAPRPSTATRPGGSP